MAAMPKLDARIASLEERLKQLKSRQQSLERRRRALESGKTRRADTRRKILVGAVVLGKVERGELAETQLRKWLEESLTRTDDRALFDIVP
jgi:multidrug efflux pump subunit AcrA (membrane-fusion protein)